MSEQFSQEYIDFILSDEAKGLQRVDLSPGDWVWTGHELGIVLRPWVGFETGPLAHLTVLRLAKSGWSEESFSRTNLTKLPTLWELLQIIEGAGWDWAAERSTFTLLKTGEPRVRRFMTIANYEDDEYHRADDDELMLAAAKLAVRAIGEKDGEQDGTNQ